MTRTPRHSQCACNPAITSAQSPKLVTPEKRKYPVPSKRLNAKLVSRKKHHRTDALFALRSAIQRTMLAARLARVPPAATSRESKSLDHATVVNRPDFVPVSKAVAALPKPSCSRLG